MVEKEASEKQVNELTETLAITAQRMNNRAKEEGRSTIETPELDKYIERKRIQAGSLPKEKRG
jgi:hypothetical protein